MLLGNGTYVAWDALASIFKVNYGRRSLPLEEKGSYVSALHCLRPSKQVTFQQGTICNCSSTQKKVDLPQRFIHVAFRRPPELFPLRFPRWGGV